MATKKIPFKRQLLEFIENNQPVTFEAMEKKFPKKTTNQIQQSIGNLQQKNGVIFNRTKNKHNRILYSCVGNAKQAEFVKEKATAKIDKLINKKRLVTVKNDSLEPDESISGDPAVIHIMNLKYKNDVAIDGLNQINKSIHKLLKDLNEQS